MSNELDGKGPGTAGASSVASAQSVGEGNARNQDVALEVARVVNLLQRLEKLHGQPQVANLSSPLAAESGGLSSLKDRRRQTSLQPEPALPPLDLTRASGLRTKDIRTKENILGLSLVDTSPNGAARIDAMAARPPAEVRDTPVVEKKDIGEKVDLAPRAVTAVERDPSSKKWLSVVAVGAVCFGGVAVGAWMFLARPTLDFSGKATSGSLASLQPTGQTAAALVGDVGGLARPQAGGCSASLVSDDRGFLKLALHDPSRAGKLVSIKVDDVSYRAAFDAKGDVGFAAPLLAQQAVVSWDHLDGTSCQKPVVLTNTKPLLRVALVWTGGDVLDLHVIEPNAWFGGPAGHISILSPNTDRSQGLGGLRSFGQGDEAHKAHVYSIDPTQIAKGAVLNAFIKPVTVESRRARLASEAGAVRPSGEAATVAAPSACVEPQSSNPAPQIQYQVHILRSGPDLPELKRDVQTFSMVMPVCGAPKAVSDQTERIIIKN